MYQVALDRLIGGATAYEPEYLIDTLSEFKGKRVVPAALLPWACPGDDMPRCA